MPKSTPAPAPQPVITWAIANLERETSDGYVYTVHWTVQAQLDEYAASAYGSVGLERPDDEMIPFADLTPELVIDWAKEKLGDEQVAAIEASLASQIAEQQAPQKATGLPWA
jgi:hypothetical protein